MKIIDLSKTIRYDKKDPWFMRIKIKHKPHRKSLLIIRYFLGLKKKYFPENWQGWADDKIIGMGVHATTHIDAPWHYHPTVNGEKAKSIDEVPLEWLYGDGIVIDVTHKPDFEEISISDLEEDLNKNKIKLQAGNIVLIKTGRSKLQGQDYVNKGTGMSAEATEWLIKQGIKVMGIDQWGWDLPLRYQVQQVKKYKDAEKFWPAHRIGQHYEYLHIEQLTNLEALPPSGFKIAVFPLKIEGASAAPARVVAIFE
jgi:kynurenine formamidase